MIEVGKKYGCLTVLDDGEEYKTTEKYLSYLEELNEKKQELQSFILKRKELIKKDPDLYDKWCIEQKRMTHDVLFFNESMIDINQEIKRIEEEIDKIEDRIRTHYKCQCKCGKVHFYNELTIEKKPKYCIYPVSYADTAGSYSTRAQNATYRKLEKYNGVENVMLWKKEKLNKNQKLYLRFCKNDDYEPKDLSLPSEEYCEIYNTYKTQQLLKNEKALVETIAKIPRVYSKNYDVDFTGKQYESLYIEECVNENLESEPQYSFTQRHEKYWHSIIVYKQYKCKCSICGKEQLVKCDRFEINPPTPYGVHSYYGYWSDVFCDCHKISSFQWIVTKLLFENNILYAVEYSFDDLYGIGGVNLLRYDFAIFNKDGSIKCLIECQGEQHFKPVEGFGGEEQFQSQIKNDSLKRQYVKDHNIKLIEIPYKSKKIELIEVILRKEGVL